MGFAASLALQPAGVWRVGTGACALVGLAGLGHWAWSQAGAGAMPGAVVPSGALLILLLGLRSGWRARRTRAPEALQLRIDALGHGHLHGPDGADRLLPLAGHRNRLLVSLARAERRRWGEHRWLSVRQPQRDSERAALGAWLVWLARGAR